MGGRRLTVDGIDDADSNENAPRAACVEVKKDMVYLLPVDYSLLNE